MYDVIEIDTSNVYDVVSVYDNIIDEDTIKSIIVGHLYYIPAIDNNLYRGDEHGQ